MSELQRYEPYLIYSEESVDENPLIDFDEIDEGDWIKYEDIKYLQQQLQASQEENAALKVQVNEIRNCFQDLYMLWKSGKPIVKICYGLTNEHMQIFDKTQEQSLAAHDNAVIEMCAKVAESYEPDEKLKDIAYASRDIRNLKTEE